MIHIGNSIREELDRQGKTVVWLARELGCHRTNIYKIFERRSIDTGILQHVCRILHHDFFQLYSGEVEQYISTTKATDD